MGRRRLSDAELDFRAEVAEKFDRARRDRGLNQSEAALELGITRQAFSQYVLRKATPQAAILARACTKWDLRLRYRGEEFAQGAFRQKDAGRATTASDFQLELFDRPQRIENERVIVTLRRAEQMSLQVTIKMKNVTSPKIGHKRSASRTG